MMDHVTAVQRAATALHETTAHAGQGLVERGALVDALLLAAVAGEHLLVIGPPGTAKSEAVRRVTQAVGGRYFEYLLGRFTEPSEIFGPIDLRKLRDGLVETETAGMLPEADIAFLDEIFLGSTAILNTLLGILNERVFRRGHTQMTVPLRLCVGAANALPEDGALAAFADRFLLRVFVEPIADPRLEELLEGGWQLPRVASGTGTSLDALTLLTAASRTVELGIIRPLLAQAVRQLRGAGISLTDRRIVKTQQIIAAATVLDGRLIAGEADLWPLILAVPTAEQQTVARETLRDLLTTSQNRTLTAAAEAASLGPLARARRLVAAGRALLVEQPPAEAVGERGPWQLKLEGVLREIDAGFAPTTLPPELADLRVELIAGLQGQPDIA